MVTQEGLLQLLAQMEEELEGRLPKIAVLRAKTDGEIKFSIYSTKVNYHSDYCNKVSTNN